MTRFDLSRRAGAEFLGTAFLLIAIVGSGIMGERLAGGNLALALLANSLATGAALVAIILAFVEISGAHLNPVVTMTLVWRRRLSGRDAGAYVVAQMVGAVAGVLVAHTMFDEPLVAAGTHVRTGAAHWIAEAVATFGLLTVIAGASRTSAVATAGAVGAYIAGAYWFTASTSFANPAVTFARAFTDTFAAIRPVDVLPFVLAQFVGALAAISVATWLEAPDPGSAPDVLEPRGLQE